MDTLAFPTITLSSKFYPMLWPSHLDLDTDVIDHLEENHYSKMLETQVQSQNILCISLQCWHHGEDFILLEAGTHPCAKCVSIFLTLPLWFPVMVLVDQILGSDPGDDWGDAGNSTSKSNCSKVFSGEDFMFMEAGTHPCANVCQLF